MRAYDVALMGRQASTGQMRFVGRPPLKHVAQRACWTDRQDFITRFPSRRDANIYMKFGLPDGGAGLSIVYLERLGGPHGNAGSRAT